MMNLWIQDLEIKKWRNPNDRPKIKFKYKLSWNSVYLEVPDIIDYKLVHDLGIQNDGSNRLDEIHQCTQFSRSLIVKLNM